MASMGGIEIELDEELFNEIKRLRWVLTGAERALRIAASYEPDEWPSKDAKLWADRAQRLLGGRLALIDPALIDQAVWQKIETAPMDGTQLQLLRRDCQVVGYYGGANSGWRINAPGYPPMWPLPTHWAPLRNSPD